MGGGWSSDIDPSLNRGRWEVGGGEREVKLSWKSDEGGHLLCKLMPTKIDSEIQDKLEIYVADKIGKQIRNFLSYVVMCFHSIPYDIYYTLW